MQGYYYFCVVEYFNDFRLGDEQKSSEPVCIEISLASYLYFFLFGRKSRRKVESVSQSVSPGISCLEK